MILWDEWLKVITPAIASLYTTKIRKYSERIGYIIDVLQKDTLPECKPNSRKDKLPSCKHKSKDEEHLLDENCKVPLRNVREINLIVIVQLLSHVRLFLTPWIAACQALLSSALSQSLLKFMCIELVMLSNHLVLYCPLLLLPSVFFSLRTFSNELTFRIRWPKYWIFSISPSSEYLGLT